MILGYIYKNPSLPNVTYVYIACIEIYAIKLHIHVFIYLFAFYFGTFKTNLLHCLRH